MYGTRAAAQSSCIYPDLGTTLMDLRPLFLKTEVLSEPFVPSFRWVDIAPITFEQLNAFLSLRGNYYPLPQ